MAYNPQDEYAQAKKYAESLNQAVDIGAAPQIGELQSQIQGVPEQFNPYRNAAEVQSRIDAKTLAEQMANTGLTRSGTNLTQQTALTTAKQNTLSTINKAESTARKELVAQLNSYIAQRDAAKQNNLATAQQQAYQNVSEYTRATSLAEINDRYNKENAAIAQTYAQENARINQQYNVELTRLNDQLTTAREEKNWLRESELQKQQAELNRQHDITIAKLNAQNAAEQQRIDNEAAMARDAMNNQAAAQRQTTDNAASMERQTAGNAAAAQRDAANNAAAMARQAADNTAAMARTQYSASKSASSGGAPLDANQRAQIDTFAKGFKSGLEDGSITPAQAVGGIASKYPPGSQEYTQAMGSVGLSQYASNTTLAYSAMNATSGSPTAAASRLGLEYFGENLKKDQVAYEVSKVYPVGTENFNMALLGQAFPFLK